MGFEYFRKKMTENFNKKAKTATHLFEVEVDKEEFWNLYLDSFAPEYNPIFRERTAHNCSACRHFIRDMGATVFIDENNEMKSIWNFGIKDKEYNPVIKALAKYIESRPVSDIYFTKESKVGIEKNHELIDGHSHVWEHLFLDLPKKFVANTNKSEGDYKNGFRTSQAVFKGSLDKITQEAIKTVLELISQGSLYKGDEWKVVLNDFLNTKKEYDLIEDSKKNNYVWVKSVKSGGATTRIKNHSIGTLLVNISEGMDLDLAVKKYEAIVAPENYKRPVAIFTKKMLEDAKKTVTELGYIDSLDGRFSNLDDITVNNILFSNKDSASRIGGDIFDDMMDTIGIDIKKFSKVEEIGIEDFIENIIPNTTEMELFLENRHSKNMVSLIAPQVSDSKSMFKWDNSFRWAYSGNITDSSMKENVKKAGGSVDGDLRFSIQWNDIESDCVDLDAHCIEADNHEIYYGNKRQVSRLGGVLDVDIINPSRGEVAVENITYTTRDTMKDGVYKMYVHPYSGTARRGFRAEIEFDGVIYSYNYDKPVRGKVTVAEITLENGTFTIKESLESSMSVKEIWGLNTNQFVPVSVAMFSPNYWDEQKGIGHKHVFFMLKDCVNTENPNSFFNEFLKEDLSKHRKVLEALGSKMSVQDVEDQLSGVGFSTTKRNDVLVKVKGTTERVLKIKF